MDETKEFLQETMLPALTDLFRITKEMADGYSKDHKAVLAVQESQHKKDFQKQEITSMLVKSVDTLSGHIRDLVEGVNKSNELAVKQNQLLETIREELAENTARLGTMAMVQSEQTEDPGVKALYDKLQRI